MFDLLEVKPQNGVKQIFFQIQHVSKMGHFDGQIKFFYHMILMPIDSPLKTIHTRLKNHLKRSCITYFIPKIS